MGLILWAILFSILMFGLEGAMWYWGVIVVVSFSIGIYLRIRKNRRNE